MEPGGLKKPLLIISGLYFRNCQVKHFTEIANPDCFLSAGFSTNADLTFLLSPQHSSYGLYWRYIYCPQRSCEGYVFIPVCLSTGGVCLSACWDTTPLPQQAPPASFPGSRHPPRAGTPSPGSRHPPGCCGRYASYWNAFLLHFLWLYSHNIYHHRSSGLYWHNIYHLRSCGLNWHDIYHLRSSGLNWHDIYHLRSCSLNWHDIYHLRSCGLNWHDIYHHRSYDLYSHNIYHHRSYDLYSHNIYHHRCAGLCWWCSRCCTHTCRCPECWCTSVCSPRGSSSDTRSRLQSHTGVTFSNTPPPVYDSPSYLIRAYLRETLENSRKFPINLP